MLTCCSLSTYLINKLTSIINLWNLIILFVVGIITVCVFEGFGNIVCGKLGLQISQKIFCDYVGHTRDWILTCTALILILIVIFSFIRIVVTLLKKLKDFCCSTIQDGKSCVRRMVCCETSKNKSS